MKSTLRCQIILLLCQNAVVRGKKGNKLTEWHHPKDFVKKIGKSRRAVGKALNVLSVKGIVEREYIRPRKYDAVNWKGLAVSKKSKISRNSKWRIKPDKRGMVLTFSLLWQEGGRQAVKDFLDTDYCKKNEDLIFYLSFNTFFQGGKRPSIKYSNTDEKEMIKGLTAVEKEIVRKGLNSPTFMDIILNGKSSNELSTWFMDVSSENLGKYIEFVLFACSVVDCFNQKGDSATEIIETLAALYNIRKPVTPLGLSDIAKLSKPVKIALLPSPRVTTTKRKQLLLPFKRKVTRKEKTRTHPGKDKVHKRKKVTKARRGRRRAK